MNRAQVEAQLNDLPPTFQRIGAPYTSLVAALAAGLSRFTTAGDALVSQAQSLDSASGRWLDIWGMIFGYIRNADEPDQAFLSRLRASVTAQHVTVAALVNWAAISQSGLVVSVAENLPALGYTITVPQSMTASQLSQFIQSLAVVRPDGVPFQVLQVPSSLSLNTLNYEDDAQNVTGAYLAGTATALPLGIGPATNNARPLLPTLLLTDPTINPP